MRTSNAAVTKSNSSTSSSATPPIKLNIKRREQTPYHDPSTVISSSTIDAPVFSPVLPISLEEDEDTGSVEQKKDDAGAAEQKKKTAASSKKSKNWMD